MWCVVRVGVKVCCVDIGSVACCVSGWFMLVVGFMEQSGF